MRRFVQAFAEMGELPASWSDALRARLVEAPADYNIGKGDDASVLACIDGVLHVERMRWGLVPAWSKQPETRYNTVTARLQRAPRSRIFAKAWQSRRCVVPIGGYYKWDRTRKPAVPHFIQEASGQALCLAGLWERWEGEDGSALSSFALLTQETRAIPAPLSPDGPVFLSPRAASAWLGSSNLLGTAALRLASSPTLVSYAVSAAYMDRSRNGHTLIEPASANDYLGIPTSGEDDEAEDDD